MVAVLSFPWTGIQYSPAWPLDIATVEKAIVARLESRLKDQVEVGHFPGRAATEYELKHRVGAVLVRFDSAEYGPVIDTEAVIQERTFTWFVAVLVRDLGWSYGGQQSGPSPGGYQMLEHVRALLTGHLVRGFRKMYPTAEEYEGVDKQGGVYYFNARYRHVTMALEHSEEPEYPKLVKAQAFEDGGQTDIAVPISPYTFSGDAPGAIQLPQINVSNVVVLSDDLSTEYVEGTDFTVAVQTGVVSRITSGAIGADATVQIGFNYADVVTAIANSGSAPKQPTN
jgi:hypothetical protein